MWRELLEQVNEERKRYYKDVIKGAPRLQTLLYAVKVKRKYGITLPKTYLEFLCITDGLNWNTHTIYGITKDEFDIELIDQNEFFREDEDDPLFYFGQSSLDFYAYDKDEKQYVVTDASGEYWEEYETFDELLEYILKSSLNLLDDEDDEDE